MESHPIPVTEAKSVGQAFHDWLAAEEARDPATVVLFWAIVSRLMEMTEWHKLDNQLFDALMVWIDQVEQQVQAQAKE